MGGSAGYPLTMFGLSVRADTEFTNTDGSDRRLLRGLGWLDAAVSPTTSQKCEAVRGGLVFEAYRLLYHTALGSRVVEKKSHRVEETISVSPYNVWIVSSC